MTTKVSRVLWYLSLIVFNLSLFEELDEIFLFVIVTHSSWSFIFRPFAINILIRWNWIDEKKKNNICLVSYLDNDHKPYFNSSLSWQRYLNDCRSALIFDELAVIDICLGWLNIVVLIFNITKSMFVKECSCQWSVVSFWQVFFPTQLWRQERHSHETFNLFSSNLLRLMNMHIGIQF